MNLNQASQKIKQGFYGFAFVLTLISISALLESCSDNCEVTSTYTYYEPVYTTLPEIRASVALIDPQPIDQVGKIYFKDGYLFVNEPGEGIHIIDNRDPSNPIPKSFLKIPGTYDLAARGNILYADSYVDLVAFDLSNIENIQEVGRLESVFSTYNSLGFYPSDTWGVVTGWKPVENVQHTTSECESEMQAWGGFWFREGVMFADAASFSSKAAIAPGNNSGAGIGGSMARFTILDDFLFALDGSNIQSIDLEDAINPVQKGTASISWDMETIFPHEDKLFVGSSSGMYIIDASSPANLDWISTYSHVRSCDPVVVDGNYAYVTLRSGTTCQGFTNQLEVINIANLNSPTLEKVYQMTNPHGLGIDNKTLFLCDGSDGLKVFDIADRMKIDENLLAHYPNFDAYDVIPFNNILMLIGADGIFQFDYSDPTNIKQLSQISVQQ